MRISVTTSPFDQNGLDLVKMLKHHGFEVRVNSLGRRLLSEEIVGFIRDSHIIIAGTEQLNETVLKRCPHIKLISRVGIGLDSVDLEYCHRRGILVTNTPDAPTQAVVELTLGIVFSSIRRIYEANQAMKNDLIWSRLGGKLLSGVTIGVIGFGRIGRKLSHTLSLLGAKDILIFDNDAEVCSLAVQNGFTVVTFEHLIANSDVVTIHCPLNAESRGMFGLAQLREFKQGATLINTARGGIVSEEDLLVDLKSGTSKLRSIFLDVFEHEPYDGELLCQPNVFVTGHMGAMTTESRSQMERDAVLNVLTHIEQLRSESPI